MGKSEMTVYTCDRCGKTIFDENKVFLIGNFKYLHVMKWFVPTHENYRLFYLCGECWDSFKIWTQEEE